MKTEEEVRKALQGLDEMISHERHNHPIDQGVLRAQRGILQWVLE